MGSYRPTSRRDPALSRLMRPWNLYFGALLAILLALNAMYWLH
jgi:hypothetical protein